MIAVQPFFPAAAREQMIQRMTDTLPVCLRKRCALTVIEPQQSLAKQLLQLFQQLTQLLSIDRSAGICFIQRIAFGRPDAAPHRRAAHLFSHRSSNRTYNDSG